MKIISFFIYLAILTSFITTINFSRVILSDLFLATAILISIIYLLNNKIKFKFPNIIKSFYFLMFTYMLGAMTSLNQEQTLIEILILFFLSLFFILMSTIYNTEKKFLNIVFLLVIVGFIVSITGIWDVMAVSLKVPRIFPRDLEAVNVAVSGFKNSGQAGAYILMIIAINISIIYSSLFKLYSKKQKIFFKISLIVSILFLFITIKMSAYIGFFIGVLLFAIRKRNISIIFAVIFFTLILSAVYINLEAIAPKLYDWMIFKTQTKFEDGQANSFFSHMIQNAILAFSEHPLFGTGIGALAGNYGYYEVHSTYLKILAETGLVGTIGYITFMLMLIKTIFFKKKLYKHNPYAEFLSNMQPFFIGFLATWAYTYHLRKREFWIMVFVVYLANILMKKYQKNKKEKNDFNKTKSI